MDNNKCPSFTISLTFVVDDLEELLERVEDENGRPIEIKDASEKFDMAMKNSQELREETLNLFLESQTWPLKVARAKLVYHGMVNTNKENKKEVGLA